MSTETTNRQVTLRPDHPGSDGKRYTVLLDGMEVGTVEQIMVTHDRKPPGSRIVTRRTRSLRWSRPGSYWDWTETRWAQIEKLLRDKLHLSFSEAEDLARGARVEALPADPDPRDR